MSSRGLRVWGSWAASAARLALGLVCWCAHDWVKARGWAGSARPGVDYELDPWAEEQPARRPGWVPPAAQQWERRAVAPSCPGAVDVPWL